MSGQLPLKEGMQCPVCEKGWTAYRISQCKVMCDRCGYDGQAVPLSQAIGSQTEKEALTPKSSFTEEFKATPPAPTGNEYVSLRDQFAMHALAGWMASHPHSSPGVAAREAFSSADAMLEARKK